LTLIEWIRRERLRLVTCKNREGWLLTWLTSKAKIVLIELSTLAKWSLRLRNSRPGLFERIIHLSVIRWNWHTRITKTGSWLVLGVL